MTDGFLFYAYWNGQQLRDLFEGLVAITVDSHFTQLAAVLFLLGLLGCFMVGATRHEGKGIITYFAAATLFWFVAMLPKVPVVIQDVRSETVYTVDDVPLAIGVFGSMANRLGYWLTQTYEQAFLPVSVAQFSRFGAVYPERVLDVLSAVGPVSHTGKATLESVMASCVIPEMTLDAAKTQQVMRSTDLWQTISADNWVNPARLVAMPDGQLLSCTDGMQALARVMEDEELPRLTAQIGSKLAPDHVDMHRILESSIPTSENLLLGLSRSMQSSLKHALLLAAIPQAAQSVKSDSNAPMALAVSLAKAQGNLASEINYRTMAKIAQDSLPKIRNALEFVVIGMFPVVALLCLVFGSKMGILLRGYLSFLLTIELWPVVASLVNTLMITYDQHPFNAIVSQFGGNSMEAIALIRETGATSQAIAGALMCAVPMIAYALVRAGDVGVGQLVSSLTAPAQSAASAQGASLAAGNVQMGNVQSGNVSQNTVSANHSDRTIRVSDPGTLQTQSAFGQITRAPGGMVTGLSRTAVDWGVSGNRAQSYVRGHTVSHISNVGITQTESASWSDQTTAQQQQGVQFSQYQTESTALTHDRSAMQSTSHLQTALVAQGYTYSDSASRASQVGERQNVQTGAGVRMGQAMTEVFSETMPTSGSLFAGSAVNVSNQHENGNGYTNGAFVRTPQAGVAANQSVTGLGTFQATAGGGYRGGTVSGAMPSVRQATQPLQLSAGLQNHSFEAHLDQSGVSQSVQHSGMQQTTDATLGANLNRTGAQWQSQRQHQGASQQGSTLTEQQQYQVSQDAKQSDSLMAQGQIGNTRMGTYQMAVDDNVRLMQSALTQTTPEALLQSAYEPSQQTLFAQEQFGVVGERIQTENPMFGPTQLPNVQSYNAPLIEKVNATSPTLRGHDNQAIKQIAEQQQATLMQSIQTDEPGKDLGKTVPMRITPPEVPSYETAVNGAQNIVANNHQQSSQEDRIALERGILLLSQSTYRMQVDDSNMALRNAFMGTWGYHSPQSLQEDIRQDAIDHPAYREALMEVGRHSEQALRTEDWQRLVQVGQEHAKQHVDSK